MKVRNPHRYLSRHALHAAHPFGTDWYGRFAEGIARGMGTPFFLTGQTLFLIAWIALNGFVFHGSAAWDVYPFILLNLMLSFQAAYSAPLILVAANRQAERDQVHAEADAEHREQIAKEYKSLLAANTALTLAVHKLLEINTELTRRVAGEDADPR